MKKMIAVLITATVVMAFGTGANAQMKDTGAFFGGGLSYAWENFDKDDIEDAVGNVQIDDAFGFNLFAGYRFIKYLSLEANFNWYDSFQVNYNSGSFDLDIWTLMLDVKAMYPLFENRFVPYLRLGGGYMDAELKTVEDQDFAWNFGFGFDYFFTPNISWGVEGKYVQGTGDLDEIQYFVGSILLGFHF